MKRVLIGLGMAILTGALVVSIPFPNSHLKPWQNRDESLEIQTS
jgi:hypothetical protein